MKLRSHLMAVFIAASLLPVALMAEDAGKPAKQAATEKAKPKKVEAVACTGSRIKPAKPADCEKTSNHPLHSYSDEELNDTGEMDVSAALRKLNPAIH